MDIHIKFWDRENSLVKTRYFDLQFVDRANQDNLYQSVKRSLERLQK